MESYFGSRSHDVNKLESTNLHGEILEYQFENLYPCGS